MSPLERMRVLAKECQWDEDVQFALFNGYIVSVEKYFSTPSLPGTVAPPRFDVFMRKVEDAYRKSVATVPVAAPPVPTAQMTAEVVKVEVPRHRQVVEPPPPANGGNGQPGRHWEASWIVPLAAYKLAMSQLVVPEGTVYAAPNGLNPGDPILKKKLITFGDDCPVKAGVVVKAGGPRAYVDVRLFQGDKPLVSCRPSYVLAGTYRMTWDNMEFVIHVQPEATSDVAVPLTTAGTA